MKRFLLGILFVPFLLSGEGKTESQQESPPLLEYRDESEEDQKWVGRREDMVVSTIEARGVADEAVLQAMRNVPRHHFVPDGKKRLSYTDQPIPIGFGQTISQPYIVAYMTEVLELEPGDKVLEIGTGSGYQAAVLAEITDSVYSIEIIEPLAEAARERLQRLGYSSVEVKTGDGYYGWEEYAPFDAVIVTAAAGHVPPPLVQQLAPGGRIIIPIGGVYQVQQLTLLQKMDEERIMAVQLMAVRFVPFTGVVQQSSGE